MATSGRRAQEAIRAHGSKKCSKHYGKDVIYLCEDCDVLACVDCATQQHKRHALEGIGNVVPQAKQKLQDFLTRVEQTELPRIKGKFLKVNHDLSKNKEQFKQRVSQIKERNEILKKELDKIADTLVKTCHDTENHNSDTLLNHQKELQIQIDQLSSKIQEVKASLQSGNDVLVLDTSYLLPPEVKDLPTPSCSVSEFTTGSLQHLEHLFGELNITDHSLQSSSLSLTANLGVVSEFTPYHRCYVKYIHAVGDKTWIAFYNTRARSYVNKMLFVNQTGQVLQTLNTDVTVTDFCISPQTGNVWYCSGKDNSVREVKDGKTTVKFTTETFQQCICMTRDSHVLVGGGNSGVVKYTQTGQKIHTSVGIPPIVRSPYRISECPVTGHVAVADWTSRKPCVSILNDELQILHTYRGEVSGQRITPASFYPQDVFYTDTGELIVSDFNNKSVTLLSGTGKYVQNLYIDSESEPLAVCVKSDAMWISFQDGEVKVLQNH